MTDIMTVMEQITKTAQENIEDVRFIKKMEIGQVVRQGDIYIHKVEDTHKHGKEVGNKLAMGASKGSRHVAESPARCYQGTSLPSYAKEAFLGPLVKSDTRFTVSHPEHADVSRSGGCYQITHQLDARTLQRVRD
jgi:glucose/arabinose dehydrogenase